MRTARWLALLWAAAALLAPPPADAQTPAKITVALGTAVDFLPAFVAKDTGIFAQHGLDVTLQIVPAPPVVPPMLVSGSVQIGYATAPNFLLADEGGLDLVAVLGAARLQKSNSKVSLVARTGLAIGKAEDLKGRKIGVPGFNSIFEMFLRKWFIIHNVPRDQVTLIETPLLTMGDLLRSAQIDAATAIEPIRGRIVASGAAQLSLDFFSEVNPDILGSFWMATRDWAGAHPAEVAAYRAAMADGLAYVLAHPDEARDIEKKAMGFADPGVASWDLKLDPADFVFVQTLAGELGVSHQTIDVSKLILP
jgi:NitT/TauT family transport system substrate-binding protein